MTTIKDVARKAGVSTSTVSRALSGRVFVEPDTKEKVNKAAKELNYRPNPLAKGLKNGRTEMLGVILPDISNTYFSILVKCIEKYATEKGYSILLVNTNEDVEQEKLAVQLLRERYIDGLAIIPACSEMEHLHELEQEDIPYVLVNRWIDENMNCVSNDQRGGCYDVMQYLIKNGHKKISVMLRSFEQNIYRDRYNGCMDALREHGLADSERYFLHNVNSIENSQQSVQELLSKGDNPTALFITSELYAFGAYKAIYEQGLRIPEDISVMGFDDLPTSPYMFPSLTTFHQSIERIAEYTVAGLLRQIENKQERPEKILLRGFIIPRESVKNLC